LKEVGVIENPREERMLDCIRDNESSDGVDIYGKGNRAMVKHHRKNAKCAQVVQIMDAAFTFHGSSSCPLSTHLMP